MSTFEQFEKLKTEPNIGKRFLAGFIDYLIIYFFTFFMIFTLGEPNGEGSYQLSGLPALIPMLFWGTLTVGFEQLFGATLGNQLVQLKPIQLDGSGKRLSFGQSLKRHLLDPIDMFFFGLVGIITINNTPMHQRVGDLWAKTIVVKTKNN